MIFHIEYFNKNYSLTLVIEEKFIVGEIFLLNAFLNSETKMEG